MKTAVGTKKPVIAEIFRRRELRSYPVKAAAFFWSIVRGVIITGISYINYPLPPHREAGDVVHAGNRYF